MESLSSIFIGNCEVVNVQMIIAQMRTHHYETLCGLNKG